MDKILLEYAPWTVLILIVIFWCIKNQIIVTSTQVNSIIDKKLSAFQEKMETKFATKEIMDTIKEDIVEVKESIAEIRVLIIDKLNSKI